jgi:DNA (cytosine-5)-methyltransferase 1
MWRRDVWTRPVEPSYEGPRQVLGDVLQQDGDVPVGLFIPDEKLEQWRYLKGAKREKRMTKEGFIYEYTEGAIAFPDPLDRPSRTILTGEGGSTPSRFKHVVETSDSRLRRLTPIELERLNGFPDDWTNTGMPESRRAFMMGNALVVGLVQIVGATITNDQCSVIPLAVAT